MLSQKEPDISPEETAVEALAKENSALRDLEMQVKALQKHKAAQHGSKR